ncbi:hypothetical protein [Clostridium perfringens]|uniref:Uncharacterized protein n=1 Tax=Clostridium perfringens F262 TaxID=883064 RepID=A0AAV3F8M9_CLOPF|nr:hypothetical protein [Clostridium perfringens]EIA15595.1 hypothetical protein HA1_16057 [Clostridium perfringens F262]
MNCEKFKEGLVKKFKDNVSIDIKDLAIINIAKCYIKHEDKEKALEEIHSLGIKFIDEEGNTKPLTTQDIDIVINEILNTDLADKFAEKRDKEITKTLKEIDMLQDWDIHFQLALKQQSQLKEIREVLKVIYQ